MKISVAACVFSVCSFLFSAESDIVVAEKNFNIKSIKDTSVTSPKEIDYLIEVINKDSFMHRWNVTPIDPLGIGKRSPKTARYVCSKLRFGGLVDWRWPKATELNELKKLDYPFLGFKGKKAFETEGMVWPEFDLENFVVERESGGLDRYYAKHTETAFQMVPTYDGRIGTGLFSVTKRFVHNYKGTKKEVKAVAKKRLEKNEYSFSRFKFLCVRPRAND